MQMLVSAEYLTNLFGNNLQELKWQLAGATTAVSGSVEAGAERELQPGNKDKHRHKHRDKQNNKCTKSTCKKAKKKCQGNIICTSERGIANQS